MYNIIHSNNYIYAVLFTAGVSDQFLQQTYCLPDPSPPPPVGSYIAVVVTAIESHARFYIQIVGNVTSLLSAASPSEKKLLSECVYIFLNVTR